MINPAWSHDPEHKDAYQNWFVSQMQSDNKTRCCGDIDERGGDAHYVDVISGDDGYYVIIEGVPIRYPWAVNPYLFNPTGRNISWYKHSGPGEYTFYCLRLANGT